MKEHEIHLVAFLKKCVSERNQKYKINQFFLVSERNIEKEHLWRVQVYDRLELFTDNFQTFVPKCAAKAGLDHSSCWFNDQPCPATRSCNHNLRDHTRLTIYSTVSERVFNLRESHKQARIQPSSQARKKPARPTPNHPNQPTNNLLSVPSIPSKHQCLVDTKGLLHRQG